MLNASLFYCYISVLVLIPYTKTYPSGFSIPEVDSSFTDEYQIQSIEYTSQRIHRVLIELTYILLSISFGYMTSIPFLCTHAS